jgi:small subunit ribosomal protein S4
MKYNGPKVKLSRKLGIPLTAKAARIMDTKSHPPGEHGRAKQAKRKVSDYARQLLEKQRLRAQYNIHERQMRNYVDRAIRRKGVTGNTLVQLLECRLDAFVLRAGLAPTIYAARQFVGHGHVLVNGQRVNLPAYELRPDDVVTVREKSQQLPAVLMALDDANPPSYIELDKHARRARLLRLPERDEVPVICELPLVIEFYSR